MATKAYVLIEVGVGKSKMVVEALRQVEGVKSADGVTGPYDIVAIVDAENSDIVGNIITEGIHSVPGVSRTVTCIVVTS